jgi:hypothetical protein
MTEKEENGQFGEFAEKALRGPRRGVYEQLLSGLLIKANSTSDQLKKIHVICEAYLFSKTKEKLDMNLIDVCLTVCESLIQTEIKKKSNVVNVAWTFVTSEENWKKYIEPWQKIGLSYYAFETSYRQQKYRATPSFDPLASPSSAWEAREEVRKEVCTALRKMPPWEQFFEKTSAVTTDSFNALKGEFSRWALNQLLPAQIVLADQIPSQTYGEILRLMTGEKPREVGELENESALDQRE